MLLYDFRESDSFSLRQGSVPVLGPLANVPEVQDNLAEPIEAGVPA